MKVSIIGGGGLVGSMTAYALQCGGVASSICLIDANKDLALGQATDLLHGASLVADQRISAGDMSEVASSNIVVITAGLRRKPEESRLDLINRNVDLFLGILEQIKTAGLKENS
jgi:L-lactate dehydrogenase